MKTLFLLVNERCDIACSYCFYTTRHSKRSRSRIMPAQFSALSCKIGELGFGRVILTGGDPLQSKLKEETFELIRILKQQGLMVIINTSAVGLSEVDIDKLISLKVDRVDISIDSHLADVHNAQRGKFSEVAWALQELIARGYTSVVTTTVVTKANAPFVGETVEWLRQIGVRDSRLQRAYIPTEKVVRGDSAIKVLAEIEKRGSHKENYKRLTEKTFVGESVDDLPVSCRMGKEYFVCSTEGKLVACFHRTDVVIGDIFNDSVSTLQESMKTNQLSCIEGKPSCFGKHCVSLFDNPTFWRNTA